MVKPRLNLSLRSTLRPNPKTRFEAKPEITVEPEPKPKKFSLRLRLIPPSDVSSQLVKRVHELY